LAPLRASKKDDKGGDAGGGDDDAAPPTAINQLATTIKCATESFMHAPAAGAPLAMPHRWHRRR
jgi:hypothetical protein